MVLIFGGFMGEFRLREQVLYNSLSRLLYRFCVERPLDFLLVAQKTE
jgi:hypothetical protein